MLNMLIGSKFYKYTDGQLDVLRLYKIKNQNKYILKDEYGAEVVLSRRGLEDYTRILQDAFITFSIVGLSDGNKDVIVTIHKNKDLGNGDTAPYAICRQGIVDTYSQTFNRNENVTYVGTTMSKDTCPQGVNIADMLRCNTTIECHVINAYMDDTLEDILQCINPLNFNELLKYFASIVDKEKVVGFCSSLKELLETTSFWGEFNRAFGILKVPFHINGDQLDVPTKTYIEDEIKHEVLNHTVALYDKDIILENINHDYILISDAGNVLNLMVYKKGEYVNRKYDALPSHEEREMLTVKN